jgi:hypothetical protein
MTLHFRLGGCGLSSSPVVDQRPYTFVSRRFLGNSKDKEEQISYEDWLEREEPLVSALHAVKPQLSLVRTYNPPTPACACKSLVGC